MATALTDCVLLGQSGRSVLVFCLSLSCILVFLSFIALRYTLSEVFFSSEPLEAGQTQKYAKELGVWVLSFGSVSARFYLSHVVCFTCFIIIPLLCLPDRKSVV